MQRYNLRTAVAMASTVSRCATQVLLLVLLLVALLVALTAPRTLDAASPPRVVATIKPLHSLVAAVMDGVGEPTLLLRGGASPHDYSLRPSDARALEDARLVFWIGEGLELFLAKTLATLSARGGQAVALADAPGIALLPARTGGDWQGHAEETPPAHGEGAIHGGAEEPAAAAAHGERNLHIWLHPANARAMVRAIVAALGAADGANGARYRANGARANEALEALETKLRRRLAPVAGRPYIVFHDAYAYLEQAFGLQAVGSIAVSPERPPGARRILELRAAVRAAKAICVFAEPQFQPRLVHTLVEGTAARTGVLDPLGADLTAGPGQYFQMMERLADNLLACLGPG